MVANGQNSRTLLLTRRAITTFKISDFEKAKNFNKTINDKEHGFKL
jgi:hypothetical protein